MHEKAVTRIAFSADGRRLVTTGWAGTWRLWDAATGHPLTEWLEGGGAGVIGSFDSNGLRVATGNARVWEAPPIPSPVPLWFLEFVEGVAGQRLNAQGSSEYVFRQAFEASNQRLTKSNDNGFYERLGRWFLADPAQRSQSPF